MPPSPPVPLPSPSPEAAAHSARLVARIRADIAAAGGAIPFERYMELVLYAPGLGYYAAGAQKLGAAGDFVTAPELTPLFGRCLARQCVELLERLDGGELLEVGAGSGAMAAELLAECAALGAAPRRYRILERSPELRERQRATLAARVPALAGRVEWLERLPAQGWRGVAVANELLDAFAVRRFRLREGRPRELAVAWAEGGFREVELAAGDAALEAAWGRIAAELPGPLPEGYTSELSPASAPWIAALAAGLEAGALLLIDYGYPRREYYHPQRDGGTLTCHYRHRAHDDPFFLPGLQDITASVEFTAVAEAALAAGLEVAGYTSQAQFLIGCGLAELLAASDPATGAHHLERMRQAKLLTLPGEMGERFKAMALTRGIDGPLRGFTYGDQRHAL